MIDEIDRKIMMTLSEDGRYSYTDLSKKLGLEKVTVAKRVERLLKDDVIAIRAVPNPMKMGYKIMSCIALDIEMAMLDSVCSSLVDIPNISFVSTMFGKYDVILFAEYRDIYMLDRLVREQISNMKGVKSIETFMISEDNNRQHGSYHIDMSNEKTVLIDEIDEKLINELRLDGRAKFTILADKLGISPATVTRRVRTLLKNGVIRITVLVNPLKFTHSIVAYLGLQTELKKTKKISSQLFNYPQVDSVITLMNGYNILAVVILPDLQSLSKFIKKEVALIDGILNIETLVRSEFKKGNYLKFNLEGMLYGTISRISKTIVD